MDNLPNLIHRLSQNSFNYLLNFDVAKEYLKLNQTASAVSFFLRCAEYGYGNPDAQNKVYSSLLAIAKCFDDQKGRELSVTNTLLQAIAFDDSRPEAYFLMAQYYERASQWQECYTFAKMGLGWVYTDNDLPIDIGYHGQYCLEFTQAIAAYGIGRKDESLTILNKLSKMDLPQIYKDAVNNNLQRLNNASV